MSTIYEAAVASGQWNSMQPEKTARILASDYEAHMEAVRAEFAKVSPNAEAVEREFAAYAEGYEQRFRAWLAARGRTASSMVTGPARFPTRRNQKALDAEAKRSRELNEWSDKARKQALKRLRPAVDPAAEMVRLEATLAVMKAANAIVRKKWPEERKLAALIADVGLTEATARKVLEPDFMGRVGFPAHTLASVRGKIKRLAA